MVLTEKDLQKIADLIEIKLEPIKINQRFILQRLEKDSQKFDFILKNHEGRIVKLE